MPAGHAQRQTGRGRKEQDAPITERRTGRRQSVPAGCALQALQGRSGVRRVAERGGPRPSASRDTRQTLQQRKQAPRRARTAEGWRGQTVQQGAGMGSWHLQTRRCKKTRARSAQPCGGRKVQNAQLADKRTGQRNSVQKASAQQGRSGVRPVARDAGLLPSVQCGIRKCLRPCKAPVGERRQTSRGAGVGECRPS